MIRVYAPEIIASDISSGTTRVGANIIVEDDNYALCVDGRCGTAAARVAKRLGGINKTTILLLSHPHYDHYYGIEKYIDTYGDADVLICQDPASLNKKYSSEVKGNVEALERIIRKAKVKGIDVYYAKDGDEFKFGEIEFVTYRDQPSSARNSETYVNQGSLSTWFANIRLLYTGDTGTYCAKKHGLNPIVVTGMHHGNWLESEGRDYLKKCGCLYYWDDDYSTSITSFLSTGRGNAKKAGLTIFTLHGDLNIVAFSGRAIIYKGGNQYRYTCPYKGKNAMKSATLYSVSDVLEGKYSGGDKRVTNLLDAGFNPGSVQGWVNKLYNLVKG